MPIPVCTICISPFKREIEEDYFNRDRYHRTLKTMYAKWTPLMKYQGSFKAFAQMMWLHGKHAHLRGSTAKLLKTADKLEEVPIEDIITRIRNVYGTKLNKTPVNILMREVRLKDVLDGEKVLIQAKRVQIEENALESMMVKLFGPKLDNKVIEGEVVEEKKGNQIENRSGETPILQPANP